MEIELSNRQKNIRFHNRTLRQGTEVEREEKFVARLQREQTSYSGSKRNHSAPLRCKHETFGTGHGRRRAILETSTRYARLEAAAFGR